MKNFQKILCVALCLIIALFALVACNDEACTEHIDADSNLKCDNCQADLSTNNDGNNDGGNDTPNPCTHKDTNLDEKCDLCNADQPLNDGKVTYTVQVGDGIGGGYSDFIVEFFRNGESASDLLRTNKDGFVYVRLSQAKYTFTLIDTQDRGLVYDESTFELTSTNRTMVVEASLPATGLTTKFLMGPGADIFTTTDAYFILGEGAYNVEINPTKSVPFVWSAEVTGVYKFTFVSEIGAKIQYHGIRSYAQAQDCVKEEDRISDESFTLIVKAENLANAFDGAIAESTPYVIGIRANAVEGSGTIKVERIGDVPFDHSQVPWTDSNSPLPGAVDFGPELTKEDFTYVKLDGTDRVVYNEEDGLYHLNSVDGKVLYIQLRFTPTTLPEATSGEDNLFSFLALISNGSFRVERLDDDMNVISKIDYSDHLMSCVEQVIATDRDGNLLNNAGVYYLTTSLIDGIKDFGDYQGWWTTNNIFGDTLQSIDTDYAWMFAICYRAD